jgi:anthranilate 1,2-dioxygenase (deaminating, decarboxylating) small subunit
MSQLQHSVEQFLYLKADLCDGQQWDEYLELFDPQSVFHVPQWDSEHVYTTDPKQGMSLIYYPDRAGLEDRVFRLRTGKSAASTPLPRTMHQISNVRLGSAGDRIERHRSERRAGDRHRVPLAARAEAYAA